MIITGTDPKTKVISIVADSDFMPLATIRFSKTLMHPLATLAMSQGAIDRLPELLADLVTVMRNTARLVLVLNDGQALGFAVHMSGLADSDDQRVVDAWTKLTFKLEVSNTGSGARPTSMRFVGKNIAGIKKIAQADLIKLTIAAT